MASKDRRTGLPCAAVSIDHEGTITRGFLFSDLRGYTAFVEQHGAAAAAELLTRYRELAREAIGRFGGAEIKTEGDSFYVVFDSVSSAVRCGLAIAADAQAADEAIRVGVGIHAGETIEADGGYVGSPVNIAARICAQAGPGEVLVSGTVRALTMTVLPVTFRSRGRRELKGIADPIELFAVAEATEWRAAPRGRRLSRRVRVALVGGALLVVAAAASIGWFVTRPSTGLPDGPWTIGVQAPMSGPGASEGIAIRNAVQLAIDQANTSGHLGVELSVKAHFEDPDDTDRAVAAARRMVGDPRTIAAVGPFTSPTAWETIPITNRAGLLECSPSNSFVGLTKPPEGLERRKAHPERINYVRLSPHSDTATRALAALATHELEGESALVINDPRWQDEADDFAEAFTALGGQVTKTKLAYGASPATALGPLRRKTPPDVVVFAGDTLSGAAKVRRAMRQAGYESTPFLSWDGIRDGSGADAGSYLQRAGKAATGTYMAFTSFAPPRADFVDAYRAAFGEEPTDYAGAAYACTQVILAALEAVAEDGPSAGELRKALRAEAVDPAHRYETVIGNVGFDTNGDSTQQIVSFLRVDTQAADGAGDWVLLKQQDFGSPQ
jgi:class 3 adenylate cyclase/ABC-type branched-subunit amino acid transport system substrate-binding protein